MSSNQHSGESGARAAEQTKGVFKGLNVRFDLFFIRC